MSHIATSALLFMLVCGLVYGQGDCTPSTSSSCNPACVSESMGTSTSEMFLLTSYMYVSVKYRTKQCVGPDGPITVIEIEGVCTTGHGYPLEELLRDLVIRAHAADDPLNIFDETAAVNTIYWTMPLCWSKFKCTSDGSPVPGDGGFCIARCCCLPSTTNLPQGPQNPYATCKSCCTFATQKKSQDECTTIDGSAGSSTANASSFNCGAKTIPPASPLFDCLDLYNIEIWAGDTESGMICTPVCPTLPQKFYPEIPGWRGL